MKKKKILITGGAGFIGSHLAENLEVDKKISKIIIVDNFEDGEFNNLQNIIKSKKVKVFKKDITKLSGKEKFLNKIDCVVHLAALSDLVPSIDKPVKYINNNFFGTLKVLNAMMKNKIKKIIFAGSSTCYGKNSFGSTSEKSKIDLCHPYAFSKKVSEDLIVHWSKVFGINFISLRFFNVYGTRSRTNSDYGAVFGIFMKQKIMKKPFTVVGNGKQKRDFIYVTDACRAINKAIFTKHKNLVLNVGSGKPQSINKLVELMGGKKTHIPNRPGEPKKTHANINLIKKKLKWSPIIDFNNGVSIILKNQNYWRNAILWDKKKINKVTKNWFKYLK